MVDERKGFVMSDLKEKLAQEFRVSFIIDERCMMSYMVNYTTARNIHDQLEQEKKIIIFTHAEEDIYIFTNKVEKATIKKVT